MAKDILQENVYIRSIEASKIWEHMHRDKNIQNEYVGMIAYSLENRKQQKQKIKLFKSNFSDNIRTNDIINVKFNQKVKSQKEILHILNKKLKKENISQGYKEILENKIKTIKEKKDWEEVKSNKLRNILYENGFVLKEINKKKLSNYKKQLKKEGKKIKDCNINYSNFEINNKYVVYKRSSAKSRTGQVLFIKEKFKDEMIKWGRMGLILEGATDVDYPSLLSYESLVSSHIEDVIKIEPKNILLVDDVISKFKIPINLVKKNKEGLLESVPESNYEMQSDIFDGESILDSSKFREVGRQNKGFMLLRQHMYKSCAFNGNIQEFIKDYCLENNLDYNIWKIKDMFGNEMLAKDIFMITTPNSLKALKFNHKFSNKKKEFTRKKYTYNYWKKIVKKENNLFGICKSDKISQRGYDSNGNILNQTSYQMLNSMPFSYKDMKELSNFEVNYINKLKNNIDIYIEFLKENKNDMNCNEMLLDIYNVNKDIQYTKIFKNKRKYDIYGYINHVKRGKIRLNGDYCTIFQNGYEFLFHAIGKLPLKDDILDYKKWENKMILKKNEVYTTLHKFDYEYIGFRNPHTSPSNVLVVFNKYCKFIKKYFNFTDNIIYTNAINFEINRILSGQDVDSDTLILFKNNKMLEIAKNCYGKYKVCENGVNKEKNKYTVSLGDMAKIDNKLSKSQSLIGQVVNLGQLYMSVYWDSINKGCENKDKLKILLQGVDICTILSEISIDMAKRLYDVDVEEQIKNLRKCEYLPKKQLDKKQISLVPNFFKYVSKNENITNKITHMETSMDYLYSILNNDIQDNGNIKVIDFKFLLCNKEIISIKTKQIKNIETIINKMNKKILNIEYKNMDKDEKHILQNEIKNKYIQQLKKYKLNQDRIFKIIKYIETENIPYKIDFYNTLYKINKTLFIKCFKID